MLCSPEFLADRRPGWEGILQHATYHERRGLGVDESVMWGDYFFVEALDRILGTPLVRGSAASSSVSDHRGRQCVPNGKAVSHARALGRWSVLRVSGLKPRSTPR